jgi:hypothetical protein
MNNAKNLSKRNTKWVAEARKIGDNGESSFESALRNALPNTYEIVSKPRDLATIYGDYGVIPDLMVKSKVTGKRLFIEKKAGNQGGNAHERAYKYLSESLQKAVKREYCTPDNPFVFVFSGRTFLKEKYQQEIKLICGHIPNNYLIWDGSQQQVDTYADTIKDMLQ